MDSIKVASILAYNMPYYNMDKRIQENYDRINQCVNRNVIKRLGTIQLGIYEDMRAFDDKIPNPLNISSTGMFESL